jgi:hypothetical protein
VKRDYSTSPPSVDALLPDLSELPPSIMEKAHCTHPAEPLLRTLSFAGSTSAPSEAPGELAYLIH